MRVQQLWEVSSSEELWLLQIGQPACVAVREKREGGEREGGREGAKDRIRVERGREIIK